MVKICHLDPAVIVPEIEALALKDGPLEKTILKKQKANPAAQSAAGGSQAEGGASAPASAAAAGNPEAERALEVVKSALRVVVAVNGLADTVRANKAWQDFLARIQAAPAAAELLVSMNPGGGLGAAGGGAAAKAAE